MRGLIFGFDGVLVDERPVQVDVLRRVVAGESLGASEERVIATFARRGAGELPSLLQEALGDDAKPGLAPRLAARWSAFYQAHLRQEGPRPAEGALDMVAKASRAGWMLGVLSPSPQVEIEAALERLEILPRFKIVLGDAGYSADGYREAWRSLNSLPPLPSRLLHPHEVLAVDTAPEALAAAARAGLVAVGVARRHPPEELAPAERVIHDLEELFAKPAGR
ncbi:MAG: HAD family hydrolase [Acidobacteriota bacterium]